MLNICFYFQVHQPLRVKRYRIFDVGHDHNYFNDTGGSDLNNAKVLRKVAAKSYLPMNALLLHLLQKHPEFKVSFSFSGVVLDQFQMYAPDVLLSFKKLVDTGRVEILDETYYHSLAFLHSFREFREQIRAHRKKVEEVFGVTPTVFRNTELIYRNDIAKEIYRLGYKGMLAEGADHILSWRSPNFLYSAKDVPLPLLLKNYKLSDDIAFRFGARWWEEYPLTAEKFARWIEAHHGSGEIINLFMDYETFGEHQWEDTGIFEFMRHMPTELLKHPDNRFVTPSEAVSRLSPVGELDVPNYVSWADIERDLSAWRSNPIQHDALRAVYGLEEKVRESRDETLLEDWRRLQTSDHFYYMCTKWFTDGDVHAYFNPYKSPYEAFISYMNALQDLSIRIENAPPPPWWRRTVWQFTKMFAGRDILINK